MRDGSIARCWCRDADLIELFIAVRDLIGRNADSAIKYLDANLRLIDLTRCLMRSGVRVRGYSPARLATPEPTLPHTSAARPGAWQLAHSTSCSYTSQALSACIDRRIAAGLLQFPLQLSYRRGESRLRRRFFSSVISAFTRERSMRARESRDLKTGEPSRGS
jgi:hypothetical protein